MTEGMALSGRLARLGRLALPVPPFFAVGDDPGAVSARLDRELAALEAATGRKFGGGDDPLMVEVWAEGPGDPAGPFFSVGSRRRLAAVVAGMLDPGRGRAVVVRVMVHGDAPGTSGAGVVFTRNPASGRRRLEGELVPGAPRPGSDGGSGARPAAELARWCPSAFAELERTTGIVEEAFGEVCEVDFVVERGRLWVYDVRVAVPSSIAALHLALDRWSAGRVDLDEALLAVPPIAFVRAAGPRLASTSGLVRLGRGTGLSPGVVEGPLVLSEESARAWAQRRVSPVLVGDGAVASRPLTVGGMVTRRGGHAGAFGQRARTLERPVVAGVPGLRVTPDHALFGLLAVPEGRAVTVDAGTGEVFLGTGRLVPAVAEDRLAEFLAACDRRRRIPLLAEGDGGAWADDTFDPRRAPVCRTPDDIDRALRADEPIVVSPGERDPLQLVEVAGEIAGYGVDVMLRVGPEWPPALSRLPPLPWLAVIAAPGGEWAGRALAAAPAPAAVPSPAWRAPH